MPCCLVGFAPPPAALHLLRRRRMASASSRAFQLRLNPLTGDSEWLVVEEADGEGEGEAPQPPPAPRKLLAATSYLDMLNDAAGNGAYHRAIDAAITDPSSHVLNIGAGTGLLSMMAAQALATVGGEGRGSVSACESYLPMGKLMQRLLGANGMENKVKVFNKRSDELEVGVELDSPTDILDVETGEAIARLEDAHENGINHLACLTETTIASGDDERCIKDWEMNWR